MGRLGAVKDAFAKGATAQQVEFAEALRVIRRMITDTEGTPLSLKAIGETIYLREQHISNFLHAERPPTPEVVEALYALAESALKASATAGSVRSMPFSLGELQRLRELAIKPCVPCRAWHDAVIANEVENRLAVHFPADADGSQGVPVPQVLGDRHPGLATTVSRWDGVGEVQRFSQSGLEAELLTVLGHVGESAEPGELPSIMHTLRTSGLDDAADAVSDAAAARPAQVVMKIALELHGSGLHDDIGRLLAAAIAAYRNAES